jgi:hypothetical protein
MKLIVGTTSQNAVRDRILEVYAEYEGAAATTSLSTSVVQRAHCLGTPMAESHTGSG